MNCLLIGGSGFVGGHLARSLRERGLDVWIAGRPSKSAHQPPTFLTCDITEMSSVRKAFASAHPDVVMNLAAVSRGSVDAMCRTNVLGTANILAAARELDRPPRLILFGSAAEYGQSDRRTDAIDESAPCEPQGPYGVTKLAATRLALGCSERWGLQTTVVRPFNIVGAGCPQNLLVGAVISRIIATLAGPGRREVGVGRTDTARDFIAIDDVVDGVTSLVVSGASSDIINICSGRPVLVADVLAILARTCGEEISWRTDQNLVRSDDVAVSFGTSAKLSALTGFRPQVRLEDALRSSWLHAVALCREEGYSA